MESQKPVPGAGMEWTVRQARRGEWLRRDRIVAELKSVSSSDWSGIVRMANAQRILEKGEERALLKRAAEGDERARDELVITHLRLCVTMAIKSRGYGLPDSDLVTEAVTGLIIAIDKFDPAHDTRLATYAILWMSAKINEYVFRNWTAVRFPNTKEHRSLFFRLKRIRRTLGIEGPIREGSEELRRFVQESGFSEKAILEMDGRLSGKDASLNAPTRDGEGGMKSEAIDLLVSSAPSPFQQASESQIGRLRIKAIEEAISTFKERDQQIARARLLTDGGPTLEELGRIHGLTRERIRQIEERVRDRIERHILKNYDAKTLLAA